MDSTMTPVQRLAAALEAAGDPHELDVVVDWEKAAEAVLELFPVDALAAMARVRALHCDLGGGNCEECSTPGLRIECTAVPYPCRTIRALDGQEWRV